MRLGAVDQLSATCILNRMCQTLTDGKTEYRTPRQFERLVGLNNIVWLPEPTGREDTLRWRDMDSCLCNVDVPGSLMRVGLACEQPTPDPMDLRLTRT